MRLKKILYILPLAAVMLVGCAGGESETPEPDTPEPSEPEPDTPENPTPDDENPGDNEPVDTPTEPSVYNLTYQASEYDPDGFNVTFFTDEQLTQEVTTAEEDTTIYLNLSSYSPLWVLSEVLVNDEVLTPNGNDVYSLVVGTEDVVVTTVWSYTQLLSYFLQSNFSNYNRMNYTAAAEFGTAEYNLNSSLARTGEPTKIPNGGTFVHAVDEDVLMLDNKIDTENPSLTYYINNEGGDSDVVTYDYETQTYSRARFENGTWGWAGTILTMLYNMYHVNAYKSYFTETETGVFTTSMGFLLGALYRIGGVNSNEIGSDVRDELVVTLDYEASELSVWFTYNYQYGYSSVDPTSIVYKVTYCEYKIAQVGTTTIDVSNLPTERTVLEE